MVSEPIKGQEIPLSARSTLAGAACEVCGEELKADDRMFAVPLGPHGPEQKRKSEAGEPYWAVGLPVHAECTGGRK